MIFGDWTITAVRLRHVRNRLEMNVNCLKYVAAEHEVILVVNSKNKLRRVNKNNSFFIMVEEETGVNFIRTIAANTC